ncbi:hypothetical protein C8Q72DRAFT_880497 [Fomitopsis betulina]|nr:hypothetical protein C8Q72DRAFT_880497 [Fomitopsis betulina]
MPEYKQGDKVEYRAVGGAVDNVAHSTGTIERMVNADDGSTRYTIKNDNTGKKTTYKEANIVKKM